MPRALNEASQLCNDLCQDVNRSALQEHQQEVDAIKLRGLEQKINLAQEIDDDQPTQLDELLSVHQEIQKHLETLINRNPSWFCPLVGSLPQP